MLLTTILFIVLISTQFSHISTKMEGRLRLVNNGLRSESNLCFVNSAVQMLHNIPRIKSLFLEKEYKLQNENQQNMNICDELSLIFQVGIKKIA